MGKRFFLLTLAFFLLCAVAASAETVKIGNFSRLEPGADLPAGWETMAFRNIDRHTEYRLVSDGGRTVIRADSDAAASGLIYHRREPAEKLPWLAWSWKITRVLARGDVSSKQGDDYPARIYVAFEYSPEGLSLWQRVRYKMANAASGGKLPGTALNYIWANKAPPGTIVASPYSDQSKMIVLESGDALAGQWLREKRNVVADYLAAFGRKPPAIIGIAIMTDTDNTGEKTTSYFGDILLTDAPESLP